MNVTDRLYKIYQVYPDITTDSRKAKPGSLFFALKGENFDGNLFAASALEQGCTYAVVDNKNVIPKGDSRYILVSDVLSILQNLARYHRSKLNIPVLGITGSNGKTTTKELTLRVLQKKFQTLATTGNLNNHIGVPLTILKAVQSTEFLIVEMGANHPGEIDALCNIAQPSCGLITNIGKAHIEGFGSVENVGKAKAELYRYLRNHGGTIFFNADSHNLVSYLSRDDKTVSYGVHEQADIRFTEPEDQPLLTFGWRTKSGTKKISTKLYGRYNQENVMAAVAVGFHFDVDEDAIIDAVCSYQPENARSQMIRLPSNRIILDAYNANPSSMTAALDEFFSLPDQHKVLIIGDMLELGTEAEKEHRNILDLLRTKTTGREDIFLVGSNFYAFRDYVPYIFFRDTSEAEKYFKENPVRDRTILMKASRGIALEKLLGCFE